MNSVYKNNCLYTIHHGTINNIILIVKMLLNFLKHVCQIYLQVYRKVIIKSLARATYTSTQRHEGSEKSFLWIILFIVVISYYVCIL